MATRDNLSDCPFYDYWLGTHDPLANINKLQAMWRLKEWYFNMDEGFEEDVRHEFTLMHSGGLPSNLHQQIQKSIQHEIFQIYDDDHFMLYMHDLGKCFNKNKREHLDEMWELYNCKTLARDPKSIIADYLLDLQLWWFLQEMKQMYANRYMHACIRVLRYKPARWPCYEPSCYWCREAITSEKSENPGLEQKEGEEYVEPYFDDI